MVRQTNIYQRVDRLEANWASSLRPCLACRDVMTASPITALRICSPLPGPNGWCMFMCQSCRRLFRGILRHEGDASFVDDLHALHMPS